MRATVIHIIATTSGERRPFVRDVFAADDIVFRVPFPSTL